MIARSVVLLAASALLFSPGCGKSRTPESTKGALRAELDRVGWSTEDNALRKNPDWQACDPGRGEYAFKVQREMGGDRLTVTVRQTPKDGTTVDAALHEFFASIGGKRHEGSAKGVKVTDAKVDRADPQWASFGKDAVECQDKVDEVLAALKKATE